MTNPPLSIPFPQVVDNFSFLTNHEDHAPLTPLELGEAFEERGLVFMELLTTLYGAYVIDNFFQRTTGALSVAVHVASANASIASSISPSSGFVHV